MITIDRMTLRELLESKNVVHSSAELAKRLKLSRQHASGLWNSRDPLGLRLMRRMKEEFGISLDELAEVDEAVPGRPRQRKPRRPKSPETEVSC